jgi:predicted cobalt transporter CbtA
MPRDLTRPRSAIGLAVVLGAAAGILAAVFFSIAGEPRIEDAIAIEEARAEQAADTTGAHDHAGDDTDDDAVQVSRSAQRGVGLFAGMGLAGGAFGALFGIVFVAQSQGAAPLRRAMVAGAGLAATLTVAPWFKYPPNPPAVGDPATADRRQLLYVTLIVGTAVVLVVAAAVSRRLRERAVAEHTRVPFVAAAIAVPMAALLALLPPNDDPITVPASLIWQFRTVSLAGNLLLWATLTLAFAWIAAERAARTEHADRAEPGRAGLASLSRGT